MDENLTEIKQESVADVVKNELDSCSQDSSRSGNSTTGYSRWAPSIGGARKSAFLPYKPLHCTALTNLQRGNTQARVLDTTVPDEFSLHVLAGRGETVALSRADDVNCRDSFGLTPLHWSAAYGQIMATSHLIWCGADVNALGPEQETALQLAAAGGHHDVLRMLLADGTFVDHQDLAGNTALMYACACDAPHAVQELLSHGADITIANEEDKTAYELAIENEARQAQTVIENFLIANIYDMKNLRQHE